VDVIDAVLARGGEPGALRAHDRGSLALDSWAQVVEREVLGRLGWAWLDHDLTSAQSTVAPDGRSARVELAWRGPDGARGRATGEVVVEREVPVLVCGEPPEAATKSSPDLALRAFDLSIDPAL
jgi:hypothetical protein